MAFKITEKLKQKIDNTSKPQRNKMALIGLIVLGLSSLLSIVLSIVNFF